MENIFVMNGASISTENAIVLANKFKIKRFTDFMWSTVVHFAPVPAGTFPYNVFISINYLRDLLVSTGFGLTSNHVFLW